MSGIKAIMRNNTKHSDIWILTGLLVIFIILFSVIRPGFFSWITIESMGFQFPELGILTIGMAITMIIGGINLSCIASANLSAIVMTLIMTAFIPEDTDRIGIVVAAIAAGILLSVVIGILNGIIIAYFHVPDILATLSTQLLIGGLNLAVTQGRIYSIPSDAFRVLGNGSFFGIPIPFLVFLICVFLAVLVLNRTEQGKHMYLYGSNSVVSRFNGTSARALTIRTYALSGLFVGIAAVIMTSRFNSASAEYASSYLLQTVLVAVLAGVNPDGGKGRMLGIVIAIMLIQIISTGMNMLRVDSHLGTALWGIILLLSVFLGRKKQ